MSPYPSLPYPSCVEVIVVLSLCLASYVEVVIREELCTPNLVFANSSVEVPCVGGLVWT